ncbi:MAG: hypothetical protein ISEC1_P1941 [Thiomicrorhabdus sp.]|nr:MAG: hypothetical protein ISEC1_P1941 [Thiomicrorhabdus sp.]
MRMTNKLQSLANVAPGATATLSLPVSVAYHLVKFKMSGITAAQMLNLKLILNGRVVQTYKSGTELQELNGYKGYAADTAGYLTWYMVKPELNMIGDQRFTKLGTQDLQTVSIEFDVDQAATTPVVTASAMTSLNEPLGVITKVLRFSKAAAAVGLDEIDNIPTGGARISAIHFKKADINSVEVEANNRKIFESQRVEAREWQRDYKKVPNTNYFHVDFVLEGDSSEALVTAGFRDFRFKLDHASAGSMDFIVEYIDTLEGGV